MSQICGYVDGVRDGVVFGWALDPDSPATPALVRITVNDEWQTEVAAIHHRADVGAHFGTTGLCGFWVRIPAGFAGRTCRIAVSAAGEPLPGPELNVLIPEPKPQPARVIFLHIQKTAGTAFREAVTANYDFCDMLLMYPDPPGIPVETARELPEVQRFGARLGMGHIRFGVHEFLGGDIPYTTMLRHPVARVISHYQHMQRDREPELFAGDRLMPLEEVLEARASRSLDNLMTRMILGEDHLQIPVGHVREEHLRKALGDLEEHFAFTGLQEYSDEAWAAMRSRFGWTAGTLNRRNIGEYSAASIPESTRRAVEHANPYDLALYEHVLRRRER